MKKQLIPKNINIPHVDPKQNIMNVIGKYTAKPSHNGSSSGHKENETIDRYSIEYIPLKDIRNGIIITTDGRYLKILEVIPGNYNQKKEDEKGRIINAYQRMFNILPEKFAFLTTSNKADVRDIITNVNNVNAGERSNVLLNSKNDYVNSINSIKDAAGNSTRYFIIFEYERSHEDEGKDGDFNTIYNSIYTTTMAIGEVLQLTGNELRQHDSSEEDLFQLNTLYEYFNKKDSFSIKLEDRIRRMKYDADEYNKIAHKKKQYTLADYIAPRGISMENKDLIWVDGTWYTYLTIKDNGYPHNAYAGWLDLYTRDVGIDVSVSCKRQPKALVRTFVKKKNLWDAGSLRSRFVNPDKIERVRQKMNNNQFFLDCLAQDEDVFKVVTTFILWGDDPRVLFQTRNKILKKMKVDLLAGVKSQYCCDEYFENTSPFLTFNSSVFMRDGHDFPSSSLASMYNYTKFMLYDNTGFVLGRNLYNGSVAAVNNFNTKIFPNGNISILGSTGSGKSFFEMFFGRRSRLTGINTYYILPVKGYEYEKHIKALNGVYIRAVPGSKDVINPMGIYPEGMFDASQVDEEIEMRSNSLLSKKISFMTNFIQLRMYDSRMTSTQKSQLNALLTSIYADYGITNDNDSIFDDNGHLKVMPTLQTLYDKAKEVPECFQYVADVLEVFVSGQYRNFVGQTNVDLSNPCIAFDANERLIEKDDLASILYIIFDLVVSLTTSNSGFTDIVCDELWKMLKNKEVAEQVQFVSKVIRGYGGALITATQEINDLLHSEYGESVISGAKTKILFGMEQLQLSRLSDVLSLTPQDEDKILTLPRGKCLFIANGISVPLSIDASETEKRLFSTDKNEKKRFKEQDKNNSSFKAAQVKRIARSNVHR